MLLAPIPVDEADRVSELDKLDVMYSEPEAVFDRATKWLSEIFGAPAVMMNLIDHDNQYMKSSAGLPPEESAHRVVPRGVSICGHVVGTNKSLVVEDLLADERFRDNPLVKEKGLRFYAGAPLHSETGQAIGALCVVDYKPRKINQYEQRLLEVLADGLMAEVRSRAASRQLLTRTRAMERDLAAARAVQRFLLPPRRQEGDGFAVWHFYHPMEAIGGDFLDVNIRPNGSPALLLADVSGHGPSAALTSAMVKSIFQHAAVDAAGPEWILSSVNRDLGAAIESGQFVTAVSAVYDPQKRSALLASAGHPLPILVRAGMASVVEIVNDLPLLIEPQRVYDRHTCQPLDSGDRLLFYTDGATEAMNAAEEMLTSDGLMPMIEANAHLDGDAMLVAVFQAIRAFAGGRLKDDVALVCLEIK
jgi:serine phosphatase RsbU (regulator of sigma subunit)